MPSVVGTSAQEIGFFFKFSPRNILRERTKAVDLLFQAFFVYMSTEHSCVVWKPNICKFPRSWCRHAMHDFLMKIVTTTRTETLDFTKMQHRKVPWKNQNKAHPDPLGSRQFGMKKKRPVRAVFPRIWQESHKPTSRTRTKLFCIQNELVSKGNHDAILVLNLSAHSPLQAKDQNRKQTANIFSQNVKFCGERWGSGMGVQGQNHRWRDGLMDMGTSYLVVCWWNVAFCSD